MTPVSTALVCLSAIYAFQVAAFALLYRRTRWVPFGEWLAASVCLAGFVLLALVFEVGGASLRGELSAMTLLPFAAMFMCDGASRTVERPMPRWVWVLAAASALGAGAGALLDAPFEIAAAPAGIFVPVLALSTGVILLRSGSADGIGSRIAGVSLVLLGTHFAGYPFTRSIAWYAPIGFMISLLISLAVIVGLVVMSFEVMGERTKALEAERERMRELEALGRFASGIAHDFNNLLTVIRLGTDTLRDAPGLSREERGLGASAASAAARATELTAQLLDFSRQLPPSSEVIDVAAQLRETVRQAAGADDAQVELELAEPEDGLYVAISPAQLDRVVRNLVVNAVQAMQEEAMQDQGGVITVRCGVSPPDDGQPSWVRIAVTDNGPGMTQETLERAFEPFFTTKGSGAGTGLGLAIVRSVVTRSGGRVEADSRPGRGTTITLELPRAAA